LVSAARQLGFVFLGITSNTSVLNIKDQEKEVEVIQFFEFDNKRKMMSVIIRDNNQYKIYCKGADSAILKRLAAQEQPFLQSVSQRIDEFSKQGLRTLCMGYRVLGEAEINIIKAKAVEISVAGADRELLMGRLDSFRKVPRDCGEGPDTPRSFSC